MKFLKEYYKLILVGIFIGLLLGGVASYFLLVKEDALKPINNQPNIEITEESFVLFIPKLDISASVITGINPSDEEKYNEALKNGVLLMPGTGELGKPGNIVIYGHSSSNQVGNYNKVFASLDNLKEEDEIRIYKDGQEYVYAVSEKRIIEPTDFSILKQTQDETLTLMTCWPIGTDEQRLIIISKGKN